MKDIRAGGESNLIVSAKEKGIMGKEGRGVCRGYLSHDVSFQQIWLDEAFRQNLDADLICFTIWFV